MKKTRLILAFAATLIALFISCNIIYASSAVVDSNTYTHPSKFSSCLVIDGIDVSYYQQDIDWGKVKRQGIDFAFIRIGYTNLDSPFRMNPDSFFEQNYAAAREAGVMVGVYYYSAATTVSEAQKEASYVLELLNGRELDLPVVFDYEYAGRVVTAFTSGTASAGRTKLTSNALAFLNTIAKSGQYEPMFYSYRNMVDASFSSNYKFNMDLIDSKYKVWEAQYSTDNSYARPFEFWQYTSSGSVTGITGNVDCNFWYYDNDAEETLEGTTSIKDASVSLSRTVYDYTKLQKTPVVAVTYNGQTLTKGVDYKVTRVKNVLAGTGYIMIHGIGNYSNVKMVPITINPCSMSEVTVNDITSKFIYNGKARIPTLTVKHGTTALKKGVDYTVTCSNNVNAGTATVKINGIRNYTGTVTKTFTISKATPSFTGTESYSKTVNSDPWTLDTKCTSGASLTYKSSDTSIASVDAAGKVTLKGKAGTATITVTSPSTQNYVSASRAVTVTVEDVSSENERIAQGVEATTLKIYSAVGDDYIQLSWTKSPGFKVDCYQIFRAESADGFTATPMYTTKYGTTTTYKNTAKLVKGKKYYYKVRGVRTIDGVKYYTQWSKTIYRTFKGSMTAASEDTQKEAVENTGMKIYSSAGSGYISLSWKPSSSSVTLDGTEVYRSVSPNSGFKKISTFKVQTSKKYTAGLTKGKKYYYYVKGYKTIGGVKVYTRPSITIYRTFR
ncbi:MAG: GH25 family lysozyme [Emergencia sp.]